MVLLMLYSAAANRVGLWEPMTNCRNCIRPQAYTIMRWNGTAPLPASILAMLSRIELRRLLNAAAGKYDSRMLCSFVVV